MAFFYINILPGGAAIVFSLISLGEDNEKEQGFDWAGAVSSAAALGLMVVAVDQIGSLESLTLIYCAAASVALFAFFLSPRRERSIHYCRLIYFCSRQYTLAVISSSSLLIAQGMALVGFTVCIATYLPLLSTGIGVYLYAVAGGGRNLRPLAGRLSNRFNPTHISTVGVVIFCLGLGSLALLPHAATVNDFRGGPPFAGWGWWLIPAAKQ